MDKREYRRGGGWKLCQPCDRENTEEMACAYCRQCKEYVCDVCLTHHNKTKYTTGHVLVLLCDLKVEDIVKDRVAQCQEHPDECVKFYCYDHKTHGCSTCVTLTHRKCEKVDTLVAAANSILSNDASTKLEASLFSIRSAIEDACRERIKDIESSKEAFAKMSSRITFFRTTINEKLDILKQNIREEIKNKEIDETVRLDLVKDNFQEKRNFVDNLYHTFKAAKESGSQLEVIAFNRISGLLNEFQQLLTQEPMKVAQYTFSFNWNATMFKVLDATHIGDVKREEKTKIVKIPTYTSDRLQF